MEPLDILNPSHADVYDEHNHVCCVCIILDIDWRVKHICVSKLATDGSDNGLSSARRQAIIWTDSVIVLIRTLGTNFGETLSEIHTFSFKKMHLKISSKNGSHFVSAPVC